MQGRPYYHINNTSVDLFTDVTLGLNIPFVKAMDATSYISIVPGVQLPLTGEIDARLGVGYSGLLGSNVDGTGAFVIQASIASHRSMYDTTRYHKYDRGLQFGVDYNGVEWRQYKPNLMYRMNKYLSAGIGIYIATGKRRMDYDEPYYDGWGYVDHASYNGTELGFYIKGTYRMLSKRISPFATIECGYGKYEEHYTWNGSPLSAHRGYAMAAIGLSVRLWPNLYLEGGVACYYDGLDYETPFAPKVGLSYSFGHPTMR